jgi:hypothetical protein
VSSPELGINVPGVSVRPRTLEELTRASIAAEMGKPYTLAEGGTRMIGGTVIGRGTPKLQDVGPGAYAAATGRERSAADRRRQRGAGERQRIHRVHQGVCGDARRHTNSPT